MTVLLGRKGWILEGILAVLFLLTLGGPVRSQETHGAKLTTLDRFVPTGVNQKIMFWTSVNPDCSLQGAMTPKLVGKPQHGTVQFSDAEDFSFWSAPNPREKCNEKKLQGIKASYQSEPGYTGSDQIRILIITPDSFAFEYLINIDVR